MNRAATVDPAPRGSVMLNLLHEFRVGIGPRDVVLPTHAQRVLAYLALSRPYRAPKRRTTVAEHLWADSPGGRAQASLRTSIWRIRQVDHRLLHSDRDRIALGPDVDVDVQRCLDQADWLLAGEQTHVPDDATTAVLVDDLLPGWEDDWLVLERERIRQVRIHALEALSRHLCATGRLIPAFEAAYAAIAAEPLRELAHWALIEVHLAEDDIVQARRQLDKYSRLLWDEMQLRPSEALVARVLGAGTMVRATRGVG